MKQMTYKHECRTCEDETVHGLVELDAELVSKSFHAFVMFCTVCGASSSTVFEQNVADTQLVFNFMEVSCS